MSTRGHWDCTTLQHHCTAFGFASGYTEVLQGGTISVPTGRHVDNLYDYPFGIFYWIKIWSRPNCIQVDEDRWDILDRCLATFLSLKIAIAPMLIDPLSFCKIVFCINDFTALCVLIHVLPIESTRIVMLFFQFTDVGWRYFVSLDMIGKVCLMLTRCC